MQRIAPRIGGFLVGFMAIGAGFHSPLSGPVSLAEAEVTNALKVKVLLTALSFDKSLKSRAGDKINLAILGDCALGDAIQAAEGKAINGLPITVSKLGGFSSTSGLSAALKKQNAAVLFVCETKGGLADIASAAAQTQTVTMAGDASWVEKHLALGVGDKDGRPELVLNINAATSSGADFDARIFGVARVVK